MRDFFKKEVLDRTYEIFGVRQTDEEKMSDDDIRFLLDGLCQVSKNYEYIPQEEQKKIIRACMLKDKTYRNINLRLVALWLEENGKKYFSEFAHKTERKEKEYSPVSEEEREKRLKEWGEMVLKTGNNFSVKPISRAELMRESFHGKEAEPTKYKPDEEHAKAKIVHMEYVKANYDANGNCLVTWLPEYEWIRKNYGKPSNEKGVQGDNKNPEVPTRENIS